MLQHEESRISMYKSIFKRILDLIIAGVAFIILLPLFVVVGGILSVTGEREVFYRQSRIGFLNKPFKIWKFATMQKNSSSLGTGSLTLRNDPRVTPFGKILRKTKMNELPQIINVLLGNMSVVGPRPQMKVDFLKFPENIQARIYNAKPGITGIGSIIFRDEEKWISEAEGDPHEFYKHEIAPYKGAVELWYQKNLTLHTDLLLIFLTAWVIIFPKSNLIFTLFKTLPPPPARFRH